MTDEVDLNQLIHLLDTALTSENPAVKDALRKLLFIVALTDSNNSEPTVAGVLASTLRKIDNHSDDLHTCMTEIRRLQDAKDKMQSRLDGCLTQRKTYIRR